MNSDPSGRCSFTTWPNVEPIGCHHGEAIQRTAAQIHDELPMRSQLSHPLFPSDFFNASHAARCVARQGVRSHAVPVALVGECSMPVT